MSRGQVSSDPCSYHCLSCILILSTSNYPCFIPLSSSCQYQRSSTSNYPCFALFPILFSLGKLKGQLFLSIILSVLSFIFMIYSLCSSTTCGTDRSQRWRWSSFSFFLFCPPLNSSQVPVGYPLLIAKWQLNSEQKILLGKFPHSVHTFGNSVSWVWTLQAFRRTRKRRKRVGEGNCKIFEAIIVVVSAAL